MAEDQSKPDGKPADATGVAPPDDPTKEEKVAGVDPWAGNWVVESKGDNGVPLSSQEQADSVKDGLITRHSYGTRYSEIPPVNTTEGEIEKTYDVPIEPDIPSKKVDWRDGQERV